MHVAFQIPYVYDYITKLCRQQAEVIQNHDSTSIYVLSTGQGEAQHIKCNRLILGGDQACDCSSEQTAVVTGANFDEA
jgi:hypothetical protein